MASPAIAQSADSLNAAGNRALATGDLKTAISDLQRATRLAPANHRIQFNLGLALIRAGRLDDAVSPLRQAEEDVSLSGEAHFLLGAAFFESRDYERAIRELQGLTESAHAERVLYMLEESSRLTGRAGEAREAFREINRRFPDSAWTHFMMGAAYESQQQPEKAIAEYQQALEKDAAIPNADFAIGYLYFHQQDTESAGKWLEREAARGCHSLANYYLGEISRAEKDWRAAEVSYRRALVCDPSNGDAHLRLGIVLADQKRFTEAIAQLRAAARLQPNESAAHYHLASIYRQMGRTSDAEIEYKKVRQIQAAKDNGVSVTGESKP